MPSVRPCTASVPQCGRTISSTSYWTERGFTASANSSTSFPQVRGFLIRPEISTFYQADPNDPWTYMWVGFDGSRAEEYLSDIGLGGDAYTYIYCMLVDAPEKIYKHDRE